MIQIPKNNSQPLPMATVLVVDDTAVFRRIVTKTLNALGFQTVAAADGQAAIDLIRQCHPNAIVTDLEMPKVGGAELIELIRASDDAEISGLPILVISSHNDALTRAGLRQLGADAFVAKPIDVTVLRKTVSRLFVDL